MQAASPDAIARQVAAGGGATGPAQGGNASGWPWRLSLALLAMAAGLAGLAQCAGDRLARAGHSADASPHEVVVGNDVLVVPTNMIRFGAQRRAASAERLDLYLHWPTLSGYSDGLSAAFSAAGIDPSILFLTVEPRQTSLDMSGRAGPLYGKFLVGEAANAGFGLSRRALSAAAGFVDEDLFYEPEAGHPFVARCVRAGAPAMAAYCMRDIHVGRSLSLTYRFHLSLMADWRRLEAAMRHLAAALLAGGADG